MAMWLDGWAGDHAGLVIGRQTNRLLTALSLDFSRTNYPIDLLDTKVLNNGLKFYHNIYVNCLTPGARNALVVDVENLDGSGFYLSLTLAEIDSELGNAPWLLGVHLFSLMIMAGDYRLSTNCTALIDDNLTKSVIDTSIVDGNRFRPR